MQEGQELVAEVRAAAARHRIVWGVLVPSPHEVNPDAEEAEEFAYQDMAEAKRRLRDHICQTYGITAGELCSLAAL
jgi:hypothetical protein